MRIAFVVHDYHQSGGHSRYVSELATRFSDAHEVHVFANTIEPNGATGIQFHRVPAWRRSALTTILTFPLPATRQLNVEFDIVHAQGISSLRSDVLTAHICSKGWFRARLSNENPPRWKEHLFDRLVSPLEKRIYQNSRTSWVIAVSEKTNRDLAKYYGRTTRTSVIHHGVDTRKFDPQNRERYRAEVLKQSGLSDKDFIFLFVGDLRKGAMTAIKALRQSPGAKLMLVSRTQPIAYEQFATKLGVRDRVVFCPPTDCIEKHYAASDGFVFPTPYDAFGMVISEAMASGLPIITSREAGAAELIEDQREGLLVDNPSDASLVAEHMKRLMADSELRQSLARAARKKMETHSWDMVAEKTMEVYRHVLAERGKWEK